MEVPEISEGVVEIKGVVREPGDRTSGNAIRNNKNKPFGKSQ
jgi:transcription antitermination factor NusA-like protein